MLTFSILVKFFKSTLTSAPILFLLGIIFNTSKNVFNLFQ